MIVGMDENDSTPPNMVVALLKALFAVVLFIIAVCSSSVGAFWGVLCLTNFEPHGGNGFPLICAMVAAIAAAAMSAFVVRRILKAISF